MKSGKLFPTHFPHSTFLWGEKLNHKLSNEVKLERAPLLFAFILIYFPSSFLKPHWFLLFLFSPLLYFHFSMSEGLFWKADFYSVPADLFAGNLHHFLFTKIHNSVYFCVCSMNLMWIAWVALSCIGHVVIWSEYCSSVARAEWKSQKVAAAAGSGVAHHNVKSSCWW